MGVPVSWEQFEYGAAVSVFSVVTSALSEEYQLFLPEWAEHVSWLRSPPARVVVATGDPVPVWVRKAVDRLVDPLWVQVPTRPKRAPFATNWAIEHVATPWVVKVDADDMILEGACDRLGEVRGDVLCFGYQRGVGGPEVVVDVSAADVLGGLNNVMSSGSPFRRWLWERHWFRDMFYEDWAFWVECAASGAVFESFRTVDYVYRLHGGQLSNEAVGDDDAHRRRVHCLQEALR